MKNILNFLSFPCIYLFLFISTNSYSQVIIGSDITDKEGALLDLNEGIIDPINPKINSTKGLNLPRVELEKINSLNPSVPDHIAGEENLEHIGLTVYNVSSNSSTIKEGIYTWNGNEWISIIDGPWETSNSGNSISRMGSVNIGTNTENDSAIFNVESSDKGVLFPQITLKNESDKSIITNPSIGLLVYNTGMDKNFPLSGYMFWNGDNWSLLSPSSTKKANIDGSLITNSQKLISNNYTATFIDDFLEVSYSGGNEGYYSKGKKYLASGSVGGNKEIYLELQGGKLESTGKLTYKITGKPGAAVDLSDIKDINIKFLDQNLGTINVGGMTPPIQATQYSLSKVTVIADGDEFGKNGSILKWYRSGKEIGQYVELPSDGSFVFAFRLYGVTFENSTTVPVQQQWFFISAWKERSGATNGKNPTLEDISEMGIVSPRKGASITYTINLTVSGKTGDRIYFKMARGNNNDGVGDPNYFKLRLRNGNGDESKPPKENNGARTSMFYWKL